jgi:hypothetical protein|tara:strand:+ start:352 stop:666 length:315 start_codon:yes stop_codon:yes gene_type:complete
MTKTNLKTNHIKIENLYKSIFSDVGNTSINLRDDRVEIIHLDESNQDPAIIDIHEAKLGYIVNYWDGYSLSETEESLDLIKALKIFKRYAKKMAKNLKRYSDHV